MKCHILFSSKNKKNITNLSSAESVHSVVCVNLEHSDNYHLSILFCNVHTLFRLSFKFVTPMKY